MDEPKQNGLDEVEEILREFKERSLEAATPPEEKIYPPQDSKKERIKKRKKRLFFFLLIFFSAIFIFCSVYLAQYFIRQSRDESQYDDLSNLVASIQGKPTLPPAPTNDPMNSEPTFLDSTQPPSAEPAEPVILPEYLPIYEMNNHTVGWIKIENTNINYPVLQDKSTSDFYLTHNFNKEESYIGAIYVREACDVFLPSDNVVIYGHRITGGQMFSQLQHYTDKAFWQTNQYITFDTLYKHHTYQIFAVFKTSANPGKGYPYHRFNNALGKEDFDAFVSNVKGLSFYDTGITPQYGDKLITLSTCEYTQENGRLVVVAVQVS